MRFQELPLLTRLLDAVEQEGYEHPTPIQEQAIPPVLKGEDVLGCAQTGTGKTAAFALPILHHLSTNTVPRHKEGRVRVLVLTPTRELAAQVAESFKTYGRYTKTKTIVIFGGVSQVPQVAALKRGAEVLVATPGRLLDLINQRIVSLADIEVFVLDEADRMLDMGFIHDIRKVVALLPANRQSLFFSATMPDDIRTLADTILRPNPVFVAVTPPATTVELIDQQLCFVEKRDKVELLIHFLKQPWVKRSLVFSRTKYGSDKIVQKLKRAGLAAMAIHGNKSQGARTRALDAFKSGETSVLVATDIAARGIDVEDITHVFNYDLPNEPETYVHRIGRTGRAGTSGIAIAFCAEDERPYLQDIERLIQAHIHRGDGYPLKSNIPAPPPTDLHPRKRQGKGGGRGRPGGGGGGSRSQSSRSQGERPRGDRSLGERPRGGQRPGRARR